MSKIGGTYSEKIKELSAVKLPPAATLKQPDSVTKASLKQEKDSLDVAQRKQALDHNDREMEQRETYANRIFLLVVGWICVIFVLLLLQGFGTAIHYKPLSDKVLLALITSTTVDIIATLILVLKYLFRTKLHETK